MESAVTLLPEPLSPTRPIVSPASRVSETPSTARSAFAPRPNSSWRFLISSKDMASMTNDERNAAEQSGDVHAENGYDGNQRVAERMLEQHRRLGRALGAGGADVGTIEDFDHVRVNQPRVVADGEEGQSRRGQQEMGEAAQTGDRKPAEFVGQPVLQHPRQPERWQGQTQSGHHQRRTVEPGAPMLCGERTQWHGQQHPQ